MASQAGVAQPSNIVITLINCRFYFVIMSSSIGRKCPVRHEYFIIYNVVITLRNLHSSYFVKMSSSSGEIVFGRITQKYQKCRHYSVNSFCIYFSNLAYNLHKKMSTIVMHKTCVYIYKNVVITLHQNRIATFLNMTLCHALYALKK